MGAVGNVQAALKKPQVRIVFFGGLVLVVIFAVFAINLMNRQPDIPEPSEVVRPSVTARGEPSPVADPAYDQRIREENTRAAAAAEASGENFMPAPRSGGEVAAVEPMVEATATPAPAPAPQPVDPQAYQQRLAEIEQARQRHEAAVQARVVAMNRQVDLISARWNEGGHQSVAVAPAQLPVATDAAALDAGALAPGATAIAFAGDVFLGVTLNEVVSDDAVSLPQARVLSGPLTGSTLLGELQVSQNTAAASAVIRFTQVRLPGGGGTLPIEAIAVDPATRRARTPAEVDRHTWSRLGATFVATAAGTYAEVLQQGGRNESVVVGGSGFDGAYIQRDAYTDRQMATIAAGRTLQAAVNPLAQSASRPPTIRIASNLQIGVMLMSDFAPTLNRESGVAP